MERGMMFLLGLVVLIAMSQLFGGFNFGSSQADPKYGNVDVAELKRLLDADKIPVVDVRTASEFAGGHVPGAINIPLDVIEARADELKAFQDKPLYVICQSGRRSVSASLILADKGYKPVNILGGTSAWRSAGFPVQ